jgi:hypothetical protein
VSGGQAKAKATQLLTVDQRGIHSFAEAVHDEGNQEQEECKGEAKSHQKAIAKARSATVDALPAQMWRGVLG